MAAILVFLTSLFTAPAAPVAAPPVVPAAVPAAVPGPITYAWGLECAGAYFGPWSVPDRCEAQRDKLARTCEQPLDGPNRPNPAFVRIADVCRQAHNGRDCGCVYAVYVVRTGFSVLDVFKIHDIVEAAQRRIWVR